LFVVIVNVLKTLGISMTVYDLICSKNTPSIYILKTYIDGVCEIEIFNFYKLILL